VLAFMMTILCFTSQLGVVKVSEIKKKRAFDENEQWRVAFQCDEAASIATLTLE